MLLLGSAFLFVPLLAATAVIGGFVFAYAAHCFLTVVEQTAAGNDEVVWPDEPYLDWLWQAAYMLWLSALWLAPLVFGARAVVASQTGSAAVARFLLTAAVLAWLLFPLSLLSSLSAASHWVLFAPRLMLRLVTRRFGALLAFYLMSGPVLAGGAVLLFLTFTGPGGIVLLPVTAFGLAAALLLYARLIGRLAHLVAFSRDRPPRPRPTSRRRQPPPQVRAADRAAAARAQYRPPQPSELPPVMTPLEGPIVGYDLDLGDRPASPEPSPPPRPRPPDLDDVPYDLVGAPDQPPERGPLPEVYRRPSDYERELARGGKSPPPPDWAWTSGTVGFLLYGPTLGGLARLAGGFGVLGLIVQMLISVYPS